MNIREEKYKSNRLNGLSQRQSALDAGYKKGTAHNAYEIEERVKPGIIAALEKAGLTDSFISTKIFEKITSSNEGIQVRALELVAKIRKYTSDISVDQSRHEHYVVKWDKDEKIRT